jgi:hypothetical protein
MNESAGSGMSINQESVTVSIAQPSEGRMTCLFGMLAAFAARTAFLSWSATPDSERSACCTRRWRCAP